MFHILQDAWLYHHPLPSSVHRRYRATGAHIRTQQILRVQTLQQRTVLDQGKHLSSISPNGRDMAMSQKPGT